MAVPGVRPIIAVVVWLGADKIYGLRWLVDVKIAAEDGAGSGFAGGIAAGLPG